MATPSDSFGSGGAGAFGNDPNPGGQGDDPRRRNRERGYSLPPEMADLMLADGRRLGDVLGSDAFGLGRLGGRRGSDTVRDRVMAERRIRANRLGHTQTILGGKPPSAGKAGQLAPSKSRPGGSGGSRGTGSRGRRIAIFDRIRDRIGV